MNRLKLSSLLRVGAILFAGSVISASAQSYDFQKYLGNPSLKDVAKKVRLCGNTSNRDYIITGSANENDPTTDTDLFLTRANDDGTTVWTKKYPAGTGAVKDWGNSVVPTSDGGFVAVGAAELNGIKSAYIIKTDQNGTLLWSEVLNPNPGQNPPLATSEFLDVIEDQGSYIAVGWIKGSYQTPNDKVLLLIKFSSTGAFVQQALWHGGVIETEGRSICKTVNGYAITGKVFDSQGQPPAEYMNLLEVNTAFVPVRWDVMVDPLIANNIPANLWGNNIISTFDGGLLLVGGRRIQGSGGTPTIDHGVILKFDAQRQLQWAKEVNASTEIEPSSELYEAKELLGYDKQTGEPIVSEGFFVGGYGKGVLAPVPPSGSQLIRSSGLIIRATPFGAMNSRLYKPSTAVSPDNTIHAFYSLDLKAPNPSMVGTQDVGTVLVGEAERVEANLWKDAWFAKTGDLFCNINCYKDNGPSLKEYFPIPIEWGGFKHTKGMYLLVTGVEATYRDIETICFTTYEKMGSVDGNSEEVRVMPNPVRSGENLQIEASLPFNGEATVTITDIIGSTVYEGRMNISAGNTDIHNLTIPKLVSGSYVVKIMQDTQSYFVKLMIAE